MNDGTPTGKTPPTDGGARALQDVLAAIAAWPPRDQLDILTTAWIAIAGWARDAELYNPGGFSAEKERQRHCLARVLELVSGAEPDIELERMILERDVDGLKRHFGDSLREPRTPPPME